MILCGYVTDVRNYVIIKSGRVELNPECGLDRQLCKLNWLHGTSTRQNCTSYGPGNHQPPYKCSIKTGVNYINSIYVPR